MGKIEREREKKRVGEDKNGTRKIE